MKRLTISQGIRSAILFNLLFTDFYVSFFWMSETEQLLKFSCKINRALSVEGAIRFRLWVRQYTVSGKPRPTRFESRISTTCPVLRSRGQCDESSIAFYIVTKHLQYDKFGKSYCLLVDETSLFLSGEIVNSTSLSRKDCVSIDHMECRVIIRKVNIYKQSHLRILSLSRRTAEFFTSLNLASNHDHISTISEIHIFVRCCSN